MIKENIKLQILLIPDQILVLQIHLYLRVDLNHLIHQRVILDLNHMIFINLDKI